MGHLALEIGHISSHLTNPRCHLRWLYEAACAAAGDEEGDDPLFATPDEGFGMEADDEGKKVKIKKLHKRCLTHCPIC